MKKSDNTMMNHFRPKLFILDNGPKNDRINLRLSKNQWNDIKMYCLEKEIQQNAFIRHCLISKILAMEPYEFKKCSYKYSGEVLENPRSIAVNKEFKEAFMTLLSKNKEWDFSSYSRLALAERINLPKKIQE